MSSALHSPQAQQSSPKQLWWNRPSTIKSPSTSYRLADSPLTSGSVTPSPPGTALGYEDKSLRAPKQSKKFNTLASVIGFKSKKNHPTIDIPAGPASPPLPFQNPPPASAPSLHESPVRPPRATRPNTASSAFSYQYDPKSPGEPSIYTYPSSEEAHEPMTPSDQLSRHRTSYQPSLFTFAEQQDHSAAMRLGDGSLGSRYSPSDARRISVMSDPSIIDPHLSREHAIRSSRVSASSYYPTQNETKGFPAKLANGLLTRDSIEKRKSSGESRLSKEIDLSGDGDANSGRRISTELRSRDQQQRHSDIPVPAVPKMSALLMSAPRPGLRKSPSENAAMINTSRSRSGSRTGSPVSASGHSLAYGDERYGKDRVASLRNSPLVNDFPSTSSPPTSARLSPMVRPKAASVSAGSLTGSNAGGGRPSPSIVTSFSANPSLSRNISIISGTESLESVPSSMANSVRRQQSISRMRGPVPPSRNPPPMANLPPTPGVPSPRPPSPLTFRSPKTASTSSLLNSATTTASDDPSIMAFDLPPSTPSSESSSVSLCFAKPGRSSIYNDNDFDSSPISATHNDSREGRSNPRLPVNSNNGRLYRQEYAVRAATSPAHTAKSSMSSNHTLMSAFSTRGDTPVQRSLRKSISQSSINGDRGMRGERQRVDSEASISSTNLRLEEHNASMFRSLRKQRSMHNTRGPGGSLALPPPPTQLRHASSFNTASASISEASGSKLVSGSHIKGDSYSSPFGSQRRGAPHSSTTTSTSNSIVSTPTTPQTHKKRSLFSSHGRDRDRRDSNAAHEREKAEAAALYGIDVHQIDRKKSHSIGLGLFGGHFSPSGSSQVPDVPGPAQNDPRRTSLPSTEDFIVQRNVSSAHCSPPVDITELLDQPILPPKELMSQMEALADTTEPASPPQFSDRALESEGDDDYWDGSSIATTDKQSLRSRVNSESGMSITFGADESDVISKMDSSSPLSATTRHFANASGSIHGRLQNERPSTGSRLPTRNLSGHSSISRVSASAARPSTADALFTMRDVTTNGPAYCPPTALPPPPRRKGAAISSPTIQNFEGEASEMSPLSPPPSRNAPSRLQRIPSMESTSHSLHRLPSHETITSYNPNRGSIFRKPSFLNIDDEIFENPTIGNMGTMSSVPEDSFLILEHGKDSLDIERTSDDL